MVTTNDGLPMTTLKDVLKKRVQHKTRNASANVHFGDEFIIRVSHSPGSKNFIFYWVWKDGREPTRRISEAVARRVWTAQTGIEYV